jgi:hypothetical protein
LDETCDERLNERVPFSTYDSKAEFKFVSAAMSQPVLYGCPVGDCSASFTRSNNMKDHLLTKHAYINVREEYPEVFLRYPKNSLKVWICPFDECKKAYSLKSNMLQHARSNHPHFKIPTYAQDSQRRSLPILQEDYRPHKPAINMTPKPLPKPRTQGTTVTQILPPHLQILPPQLGYLPQTAGPPTNFIWQPGGNSSVSPLFIPSSLDSYMTPDPQALLWSHQQHMHPMTPAWNYAGGQMIYGVPQPSFTFEPQ